MKKKNYLNPHLYEVMNDTDKFMELEKSCNNKYGRTPQELMRGYKDYCDYVEREKTALSAYQTDIILWAIFGDGDAMVNAVAGSGKSFTLKYVAWALHKVFHLVKTDIEVVQFNRAIAEENVKKFGSSANSSTMHSIAYKSFKKSYIPKFYFARYKDKTVETFIEVEQYRWEKAIKYNDYGYIRSRSKSFASMYALSTYKLTEEQIKEDPSLKRRIDDAISSVEQYFDNVIKLFAMCRMYLVSYNNFAHIKAIAEHFRIDQTIISDEYTIVNALLAPEVGYIPKAFDASKKHMVSFDDMLIYGFSSSVKAKNENEDNLSKPVFLLADEVQDFNKVEMYIAKRMGSNGRCLCVGDPRQSINGFCGADTDAFYKMKSLLNAVEFPLSVCYRCDKDIIALAQQEVAHITARDNAENGVIRHSDILEEIRPNDLLLFRKLANQIKVAMLLNKNGVLCRIKGGDGFQSMLENAIKGWKTTLMSEVIKKMENKLYRMARKVANDKKISTERAMQTDAVAEYADIVECVKVLANDSYSVEQALAKVKALFSDKIPMGAVVACTMHKSKGLEANRVWLMENPIHETEDMLPWEIEQEHNLWYVAVTRAKHELIWFDEDCDTFDFRNYKWDRSKMVTTD